MSMNQASPPSGSTCVARVTGSMETSEFGVVGDSGVVNP
jgi:hypothetical protein